MLVIAFSATLTGGAVVSGFGVGDWDPDCPAAGGTMPDVAPVVRVDAPPFPAEPAPTGPAPVAVPATGETGATTAGGGAEGGDDQGRGEESPTGALGHSRTFEECHGTAQAGHRGSEGGQRGAVLGTAGGEAAGQVGDERVDQGIDQ